MQNNKVFGMIGLAMRAAKLDIGEAKAEESIRHGKSKLVIISTDASQNTKKKFTNACNSHRVRLVEIEDRYLLGKYTGRDFATVISVTEQGFATQILKLVEA